MVKNSTQSELDDLENLKPEQQNNDKGNDKGDKEDKKSEADIRKADIAMTKFGNLLDQIKANKSKRLPITNEPTDATNLIDTILKGNFGFSRQQLEELIRDAKEIETPKENYSQEFQMKDFDYLAEKFIQKKVALYWNQCQ